MTVTEHSSAKKRTLRKSSLAEWTAVGFWTAAGSERRQNTTNVRKTKHKCFMSKTIDSKFKYIMNHPHVFVFEPWWRSPGCHSSSLWRPSTVARRPASWRSTLAGRSGTRPACGQFDSRPEDEPGSCPPRPPPGAMTPAERPTCRR